MSTFTVSKLAEASGVNIETVRFYEREGLLPKPTRAANGYRYYAERDVERLRFIQRAKQLGFSLKEISDLLLLWDDPDTTCGEVHKLAQSKVNDIAMRMAALAEMKQQLDDLVGRCPGGDAPAEDCVIIHSLAHGGDKEDCDKCDHDQPAKTTTTSGAASKKPRT